jgi:hypothetical protein
LDEAAHNEPPFLNGVEQKRAERSQERSFKQQTPCDLGRMSEFVVGVRVEKIGVLGGGQSTFEVIV